MRVEQALSYPVSIFIAGNYDFATAYTGGCEEGVVPDRTIWRSWREDAPERDDPPGEQ
jgi:hypothetical protein